MAKLDGKKYKLVLTKKMPVNGVDWKPRRFYQLMALRDIPMHNVKAGDMGGYVSSGYILSHDGDCWIGENAQIIDTVTVAGDAYVGGNVLLSNFFGWPLTVKDRARITGNASAFLHVDTKFNNFKTLDLKMVISGHADISGEAMLRNVREVSAYAKIHGNAFLSDVVIVSGTSDISGKAEIKEGVSILGNTEIFGKTIVNSGAIIRDSIVSDVDIANYAEVYGQVINPDGMKKRSGSELTLGYGIVEPVAIESKSSAPEPAVLPAKEKRILAVYQETLESIASYETDIVKIIKYPVMTDRTDPFTRTMAKALKEAQYFAENPTDPDFMGAVRDLEDAYLAAESNALKIASSLLSETEVKKVQRVKDMLSIASNEVSSEQEKKAAFKQAFKQLEGIIAVPEVAVDTFRIKIGLQELEM